VNRKLRERTYQIAARAVVSFGEFERWCLVQERAARLVIAVNETRRWSKKVFGGQADRGLAAAIAELELALVEAKLMLSEESREQLARLVRTDLDNTEGQAAIEFSQHGPLSDVDPAKVYDVATTLLLGEHLEELESV